MEQPYDHEQSDGFGTVPEPLNAYAMSSLMTARAQKAALENEFLTLARERLDVGDLESVNKLLEEYAPRIERAARIIEANS